MAAPAVMGITSQGVLQQQEDGETYIKVCLTLAFHAEIQECEPSHPNLPHLGHEPTERWVLCGKRSGDSRATNFATGCKLAGIV